MARAIPHLCAYELLVIDDDIAHIRLAIEWEFDSRFPQRVLPRLYWRDRLRRLFPLVVVSRITVSLRFLDHFCFWAAFRALFDGLFAVVLGNPHPIIRRIRCGLPATPALRQF